jgi:hypothetical protein
MSHQNGRSATSSPSSGNREKGAAGTCAGTGCQQRRGSVGVGPPEAISRKLPARAQKPANSEDAGGGTRTPTGGSSFRRAPCSGALVAGGSILVDPRSGAAPCAVGRVGGLSRPRIVATRSAFAESCVDASAGSATSRAARRLQSVRLGGQYQYRTLSLAAPDAQTTRLRLPSSELQGFPCRRRGLEPPTRGYPPARSARRRRRADHRGDDPRRPGDPPCH